MKLAQQDTISTKQYFCIMGLSLLSPIVRILPGLSIREAGAFGWLGAICAIFPGLGYGWILWHRMSQQREGESLEAFLKMAVGSRIATWIQGLFLLWFLFYAGFTVRSAATRLADTIYNGREEILFAFLLTATACIVASGNFRSIGRTAEVLAPAIAAVLIAILILSARDIKIKNLFQENLYPEQVLGGMMPETEILMGMAYFIFQIDKVKKSENGFRQGVFCIVTLWAAGLTIIIWTTGIFGQAFLQEMKNPFYMMVKNIRLGETLQRIESVIVPIWCVTDVLFLSVLLRNIDSLIKIKEKRKTNWFVYGAIIFGISRCIGKTDVELRKISEFIVPVFNLGIVGIMLPIIYIVLGRRRKKRGEKSRKKA